MKQLTLLLILLAPMLIFSQGVFKMDYRTIETYDTFDITTIDTSWVFYTTANYTGAVQVYYTEFTGTLDCVFKMQATLDDGTNWFDLNMSSFTPTDTVGIQPFHITYSVGTDYDRLRLLFDRNSVTGGKILPDARLNRRK